MIGDEERPRRAELLQQLATNVYLYLGLTNKALEASLTACTLWRELGNVVKAARECFEQSLHELIALNDIVEQARTQEAFGLFYRIRNLPGDQERGEQLLSSAQAIFQRLGLPG